MHIIKFFLLSEHGVEVLSALSTMLSALSTMLTAIITLFALLFTFYNFRHTNKRLEEEERKKSEKTLEMIDLLTKKEKSNITYIAEKLDAIKHHYKDMNEDIYEVIIPSTGKIINSKNKEAFIIAERVKVIIDEDVKNELHRYLEILETNLRNNHVNLNSKSLEKITDKIINLNKAIDLCERISNTEYIYNTIGAEVQLPFESQYDTKRLYDSYDYFRKILIKVGRMSSVYKFNYY